MDITDVTAIYLSQIINLLHGSTGSTMGALSAPVDLEHFVYETGVSEKQLEARIIKSLADNTTLYGEIPTTVSAKFMKGNVRDVCFIDITINNSRRVTFKIH